MKAIVAFSFFLNWSESQKYCFLKNIQFNFTFWHFLLLLNINLKMWMHVCVNVFRNMHWLIFHFSYFMHFLNLLLTLPECSAQVLQREFMGLNLEQSVWFNRYLLNKTHGGGGPPSVQPSHSGRNGCVSWVFVTLPVMATALICGVALPSGLTLTRRANTHSGTESLTWTRYIISA